MAFVNEIDKLLAGKIVYFGPDLSGKCSNLRYLYGALPEEARGQFLKLERKGDTILFLDCIPQEVNKVGNYIPRAHICTPMEEIKDQATYMALFRGADGVVFVANALEEHLDENRKFLQRMKNILKHLEIDEQNFPIVLQFNKGEMPGALSEEELDEEFNEFNAPFYMANAVTGVRVEETFNAVAKLVFRKIGEELQTKNFKGWFRYNSLQALLTKNFDKMEDYTPELKQEAAIHEELEGVLVSDSGGLPHFEGMDEEKDIAQIEALLKEQENSSSDVYLQGETDLEALFSDEPETLDLPIEEPKNFSLSASPTTDKTILAGMGVRTFDGTIKVDRDSVLASPKGQEELFGESEEENTITATLTSTGPDSHAIKIPIEIPADIRRGKFTLTIHLEFKLKSE